jgi:hypothetical protein
MIKEIKKKLDKNYFQNKKKGLKFNRSFFSYFIFFINKICDCVYLFPNSGVSSSVISPYRHKFKRDDLADS